MTKIYNIKGRSYSDIKAELHRAKDKIAFLEKEKAEFLSDQEKHIELISNLQANIQELQEEIQVLSLELKNTLMYPEHYHEEKHTAFQLGKETQKSISKSWAYVCFGAGSFGAGMVSGRIVKLIIEHFK